MKTLSQISHFSISLPPESGVMRDPSEPKAWRISSKVLKKYLLLRKKSVGNQFFQIIKGQTLSLEDAKKMLERLSNTCFLRVLQAHQFDASKPLEVNRYVKLHWLHEFAQVLPDCNDEEEAFEFAQAVWNQILVWCLQGNNFYLKDKNGYIFEQENNFWWVKI